LPLTTKNELPMLLEGKRALVTGGSRGIGQAVAIALAREGAEVAFTFHHNTTSAEQTAAAIRTLGRSPLVLRLNLAETSSVDELFANVASSFGTLDIFVSNAVSAALRPVMELQLRHWERILAANLTAFFQSAVHAARLMKNGGSIIGISSLGSRNFSPGYAALGVAKAGIETLARYLAVELADRGINVNVVCPGIVETKALEAFSAVIPDVDRYKQALVARTPAKRIGTPQDAAGVVLFLCTPQAEWIRGQTIIADGGLSLVI
jgi:enoyl-[acyl-carrier protein] reductase III